VKHISSVMLLSVTNASVKSSFTSCAVA